MSRYLLFDLDGTLTESGEGIIRSVQYALEKMGKPETDVQKLRSFIGPPLIPQFMSFSGMTREEAGQAVQFYRERYSTTGVFENRPYPGIPEMLQTLTDRGYVLSVASSKPEHYVRQILEHFGLTPFFHEIVGANMDEKRTEKADVIEEALKRLGLSDQRDRAIMVGDKEHDVLGAQKAGIPCVAVTYGYGSEKELGQVSPWRLVSSVAELGEYLLSLN